ncbi:perlucin-like protein [Ruditapes philippinarum]|uniref:perlucin-like protein n=1 Tax=Ruditapes philippinarum TaxID=129788 RepID=UPI00295BAD45|nr:perlucin-like protein [Ruditapes philippinarum]
MKTVIVLLFVVACLAQGINGKACCSDGWIAYKDHCYHIGYGNRFTFSAARVYCQSLGAYLVRLDTLDENTFLKGFLKKTNAGNTWMGLTDKIHEGIWRWSDTNRHATFSDWGPGEPNNFGNRNEDCVLFYVGKDYKWNDGLCHDELTPLCEKD